MRADEIAAANEAARRSVRSLGNSGLDVDDARQEALIAIWLRGHTAPTEAGAHRRFSLRRLGRNGVVDALRRGGGRTIVRPVIFIDGDALPEQFDFSTPEKLAKVGQAIATLSVLNAALVTLLLEFNTDVEIAAVLHKSPTRVNQLKKKLRAHFAKYL